MTPSESAEKLTVLYDGGCPLCRREIAHVQGLAQQRPDSALCFVDISSGAQDACLFAADRATLLAPDILPSFTPTPTMPANSAAAMTPRTTTEMRQPVLCVKIYMQRSEHGMGRAGQWGTAGIECRAPSITMT